MRTISAVIIARNEETNIVRCLKSVAWVDEIILVDTGSMDNTVALAAQFKAKIYKIEWRGFGQAKACGIDKATSEWILSIDADEVVSPSLAAEIRLAIDSDNAADGYFIPRRTNFLGQWIDYSRWHPDYVLRLFVNKKGSFGKSLIHERTVVDGSTDHLDYPILHYSYPNTQVYMEKFRSYTTLGAEELHRRGKRFRLWALLLKPAASFYRHFIFGRGFLDGLDGFLIAVASACGTFSKYRKLRLLDKDAGT
jgi:glycosyltransferase involved in cell wall biosynthesis